MERVRIPPRRDWPQLVEAQGFTYHSLDDEPYWDESVHYRFRAAQIDELETATYELDRMCLAAVEHVVTEGLWDEFGIPPEFREFVRASWERDEFTLYGRFDLAYDGRRPPRLLEYNADTPTALLEAAVIQWYWFQDVYPRYDQFNSVHERLIEAFSNLRCEVETGLHFAAMGDMLEDFVTVQYLRDCAMQAKLRTDYLDIESIGWDAAGRRFVDLAERPIEWAFKLYPWEWMLTDEFGAHLTEAPTRWFEPPWKMILSNKAILPVLWRMFPQCPYLLRAEREPWDGSHVRKPLLSREGQNIRFSSGSDTVLETGGAYGCPYVYQERVNLPSFDGRYPVIGSWIVNGHACGIGIREDDSPITQNTSRFVPHVFTR